MAAPIAVVGAGAHRRMAPSVDDAKLTVFDVCIARLKFVNHPLGRIAKVKKPKSERPEARVRECLGGNGAEVGADEGRPAADSHLPCGGGNAKASGARAASDCGEGHGLAPQRARSAVQR